MINTNAIVSNARTACPRARYCTNSGCTDAMRRARCYAYAGCANSHARCDSNPGRTDTRTWQNPNTRCANINWTCHTTNRYPGTRAIHHLSACRLRMQYNAKYCGQTGCLK